MKVFISWSGERSRQVACLLDEWLQCVLQAVDPWMSSKDIDRGSLWFSEISDQLKDVGVGIICVTKENKEKPWILFEAGSLAKGLKTNRVCTILIDLLPQDIEDPLAQFNHTLPNKDGLFSLARTLNNSLGDKKLKEAVLDKVFDTYWDQFETKLNEILSSTPETTVVKKRASDDILNEILMTTRTLEKRLVKVESDIITSRNYSNFDNSYKNDSIVRTKIKLNNSINTPRTSTSPSAFVSKKTNTFWGGQENE